MSGLGLPAFPPMSGLGSPLRAPHSLSPCRRGPCRNEPVCLQHTFFCVCPAGLQASLQRPVQNKKTGRFSSSGSFLRRGRDSILNSNPLQTPLLHTIVGHFFTDDLMCSYSNLGYFWDIFTFAESINQRMDLKL